MFHETAEQIWARLDGEKQSVLQKAERYAALTVPTLMLPQGVTSDQDETAHEMQSVGAQALNHITNKVMLAMFAPSRPAMRLELGPKAKAKAGAKDFTAELAAIERDAASQLDKKALRPTLYRTIRLLVATGNTLQLRENETMRSFSLRYYCVKRTLDGRIHTLIVREEVCADELPADVRDAAGVQSKSYVRLNEQKVCYYRLVQLQDDGRYLETQWVDSANLGEEFESYYTAEDLPWDALCWSRPDEANYGVGLVEEYSGDFEALSTLCESVVDGAVVGTEVRWLVSPAGITQVDDLKNSKNGDVLPGRPEDVNAINPEIDKALDIALKVSQHWEQRVARGFLMTSALTRNAERVTAEEIRMTAMELETSLGGVYSYLSHQLQLPLFRWLLELAGHSLRGTDIELVIVTGLAALSRTGDLENLAQALDMLGKVAALPEALQGRLKFDVLAQDIGAGFNVDLSKYIKDDATYQREQAQMRAAQMVQEVGTQAGIAEATGQQ